jgi:hypothetical protein
MLISFRYIFGTPMMYRPCDRPPPSEIFRNDFASSVATTETLEGPLPSK